MLVSYHTAQTYENQFAIQREAFYATGETNPYVIFDGTNAVWEQNPSAYAVRYTEAFDIARTVTPLFNITIENPVSSATQGSFDLELVPTDTLPDDEIHAFIAICEDSLPGAYRTFMYVCRDMQDLALDLVYTDTLQQTIMFVHAIDIERLSAIVFVQDIDTKEIFQSAMTRFQEE